MNRFNLMITAAMFLATLFVTGCGEEMVEEKSERADAPAAATKPGAVTLSQQQADELSIQTVEIKEEILQYSLAVPAMVLPAPDNIAKVSAPIDGRITKIYRHEGDYVSRGTALLQLESLRFAELLAAFFTAQADQKLKNATLSRVQQLVEKKISPQSRLEQAEADYARTRSDYLAARAQLLSLGVSEEHLQKLAEGEESNPALTIYSPISGIITSHKIDPGQAVTALSELLTILDLSEVLVRGYISPEEAQLLNAGDEVSIYAKAQDSRMLKSKIKTINPALDEMNKSVTVNAIAKTIENWPKPGQNLRMEVLAKTTEPVLSVPVSAIEYEGDNASVFVETGANTFEKRSISILRMTQNAAILSSGLAVGERVAVSNVFDLKAISKYEEFAE